MSGSELLSQGGMLFITLFVMMLGLILTYLPYPILPGTMIMWGGCHRLWLGCWVGTNWAGLPLA